MKYLIIVPILLLSALCSASEDLGIMKVEIEYLLIQLEKSECKFKRNDSWHSGADAANHIRKKYEYLLDKNQIKTTESFIVKAASESSTSGKPYEVQCKNKESVLSYVWFTNEMNVHRNLKNH